MASDNVELFTYTTNIGAGATVTTEKVLLSQYISISILAKCDQDLTIVTSFSGDGKNFDYSVSRNLASGANDIVTSSVLGKWCRLSITNLGVVGTTYVRLYCYASPSNSSIVAKIEKIGNFNPSFSIDNLPTSSFGDMRISEPRTKSCYVFNRGTTGSIQLASYRIPYRDLKVTVAGASATSQFQFLNGLGGIRAWQLGETILVQGKPTRYDPGYGLLSRFTVLCSQGLKNVVGPLPSTMLFGIGNSTSTTINNFLGFGYINQGDPTDPYAFGICWINGGVRTFYPRSVWNIDKADGTYQISAIDVTKIMVCEIDVQYLGGGCITFKIEDFSTGKLLPVHQIRPSASTTSTLSDPYLGFLMYGTFEAGSTPVTLSDSIATASFQVATEGERVEPYDRNAVYNSIAYVSATEKQIISLYNPTTWYGTTNNITLTIDYLSFSCDGTKLCTFNVYRNATLVGAVFSNVDQYFTAAQKDTTGVYTAGTGVLIHSCQLGKSDNEIINLSDLVPELIPGDLLTLTVISTANSDVNASLSFHVE